MPFQLSDSLNFLKNCNSNKIANTGRLLSSYYYSRLTNSVYNSGYPLTISIEPTTSCNLRCPECVSGLRSFSRPTGMISPKLFENIIDQTKDHLLFLYLYFQGEPYLHPQFHNMVNYASRKNIYTVTSTNAHFFNDETARSTVESGLSRIIISIDGTDQASYAKYRIGGSLEKVIEGTKNLIRWKQKLKSTTPHIIFQMVVFSHNENQISHLFNLSKDIGVDEVKLKSAQVYDFENGNSLIPANEKYARYKLTMNSFYQIKNSLQDHCWKMWHSCVVTWDGKVIPCCFDKDAKYVMGDLEEQTFKEIWNGQRYQEFRSKLFQSRREIDICTNCSEGTKVWI